MRDSSISLTVDLNADGVSHGFMRLPYSRDDSAWGSVMIPITVAKNGDGPTALLTGANHGDEYEGPLALTALASTIDVAELTGRVIIVPFMNMPAFSAGTRTSPIDAGNMNRVFPGRPDGTVTEKIADYFQRYLLPLADVVLDFHSGGKTLNFLPFAASHVLADKEQEARCSAARDAFNAPYSMLMLEIDSAGMYDDAVEALGKTFVTTELGGAGTSTPETVAIARKGLRNLLIHAGIMQGEMQLSPSRHLVQDDDNCFHFSPIGGMIEYTTNLGGPVAKGDVLARIWDTTRTGVPPLDIYSKMDGLLAVRHTYGLIQPGDCLAVLAQEDKKENKLADQ
ncbi:N(2)-acetyl-L-2,4-diaminobutanoate deacetylase DoeB [Parasedimentitalea psychrophila]|uniref:N(2)-acetyl-L-2,4-diaminobutanoate deacetylase DoeB n=1 Tax=Parasedimentitalea psychrophila TaxID=2997337 RepID=A0A9Y2KYC1_9RHOB|nr:N(2)-acetyl-L-2,4-diaminobutanoate deacetylase DoeB [Parasedimentitalea psychrophila]WIY24132.1 N(2)-acetyl-L-2,4-diaminobutanoate deacetylase DoeB [Parasedimentitalea psychrophila]